jgi:hypothetical protein
MTQVALARKTLAKIDADLKSAGVGGVRFAAPGQGLYLLKVWY